MKARKMFFTKGIGILMLAMAVSATAYAEEAAINMQQIQTNGLKKIEMNSDGKPYEVYLSSDQLGNQGEKMTEGAKGTLKLVYALKGSQEYKACDLTEISKEMIKPGTEGEYIKVLSNKEQGMSDFLTIYVPQSATNGSLYIYEIVDGEMQAVPVLAGDKTLSSIDTMLNADHTAEFTAIGNSKYKGVSYSSTDVKGYYMNIYKYNPTKKALEVTGRTTRWLDDRYKDYPFAKPYTLTQKEIKDIIVNGHAALAQAISYTGKEKVVDGRFKTKFANKEAFAIAEETYWSPEYIQQLFKKYGDMFKETEDGLYIGLGDIGAYFNLQKGTITKVKDFGNKKKVFMKVYDYEGKTRNITFTLAFTNHGWILQGGGSNPML